ncbi:MAG TPA: DNA repair exonuclease [Polyangiaceae bacterium]
MPKLVHAADLHLDSPLTGLERYENAPVAELRGATRGALDRLVELCVSEHAAALVIAGDLFDGSWRDYSSGLFLCGRMARLREAGVEVVWIRGNHDAASRLTRHLRMPENVRELSTRAPESVSFEELDLVVHGQGFPRAAVDVDMTARYPAPVAGTFNVGLLHTALEGREGHAPYAPCRLSTLVDHGYQYWALGHVHGHEVVARAPWVVYPGNLQGRHARETGAKGAVVVDYEGGRVTSVEHRPLDVVRWARCEVDASRAQTLDDVAEAARLSLLEASRAAGPRLLATRVRITGASAAHAALRAEPERATAFVRAAALDVESGAVWIEKVELATRPPGEDLLDLLGGAGPLGYLLKEVEGLRADPQGLAAFAGELSGMPELTRKVRAGAESGGALADPALLLDEALALVLSRLAEGEGP